VSAGHAARVARYYEENTQPFYLRYWDDEDIHFGLFEGAGDRPPANPRAALKSALKAMTAAIVAPARIGPGDLVVDAGCGIGGALLDVAGARGCRAVGLTISPLQVEIASRRASELGLSDTVRFERADCSERLPLPDASVDVVISIEAACHFADKPRFARECARVLRPGGRLAASDWMKSDACSLDDEREHITPVCQAWRLAGLESREGWRAILAEAGFQVHEVVDLAQDVIENARIMQRARVELMLEDASASHPKDRLALWLRQYETLSRAWLEGHFTLGRLLASR